MAKLTWGDRRYEAGVSHGAYYPIGGEGEVWNGLISVVENAIGAEKTSYYMDGVKLHDFIGSRDFQATITALSTPPKLRRFMGEKSFILGVRLCHQPMRRFNLTYRTETDDGYKIHLVFNVLASPLNRTIETLDDGGHAAPFAWRLDATPVQVDGFRPTAHFVVDSAHIPAELLSDLEDMLYGTEEDFPRFPYIEDLLALFAVAP